MNLYKCDCCGMLDNPPSYSMNRITFETPIASKDFDLCPGCFNLIRKAIADTVKEIANNGKEK